MAAVGRGLGGRGGGTGPGRGGVGTGPGEGGVIAPAHEEVDTEGGGASAAAERKNRRPYDLVKRATAAWGAWVAWVAWGALGISAGAGG